MSSWLEQFIQKLEAEAATAVLAYVKANAVALEAELQPFVQAGETSIKALAAKVSPILGELVTVAVNYLGPDLPKYEGSAVAWIEATLAAFIAKVG
jgi:hypothetical protein